MPPPHPKIYHIVHVDRLASVVGDGYLWCDRLMVDRQNAGTTIGMSSIKERRLRVRLASHPELAVGDCVPFYFCPRSVMLFLIHRENPELTYKGGQGPIVHLEADLRRAVEWADGANRRWAFTLSNAGAYYFEDRCDLARLDEINWSAVAANKWSGPGIDGSVKDGKQAEFLVERQFPWTLVDRIGVCSQAAVERIAAGLAGAEHRPRVEIRPEWYY
jgi:hypothetical protein